MIKLAGTWTFTQGSATAVGVDTQALTAIFVGDAISIDRDKWYRVLTIISDTSITFEPAFVEATASGAQGWLLPVSTTRPSFGALSAQFTDLRSRYSEVMVVSGADRRITLNKAAVGDFSEIIHQTAGGNKFKTGLIADNEWALMAFINGAWANVLKTVTTGVSPSQAVSLSYALAIGVGVGTAALPGMAFVGRTDTGFWSPAAATLAASAGGVEVWRSTASLITLAKNLKLSKASPIFDINAAAAGQARLLRSYTNDVQRWQIDFGDGVAEAGGNAGSDFYIRAYNDAGASIGNALKITRSSMLATFGGNIAGVSGTLNITGALAVSGDPTFGSGGTGVAPKVLTLNAGSGAASGPAIMFQSNSINRFGIGAHAVLLGTGTSSDLVIYGHEIPAIAMRMAAATGVFSFPITTASTSSTTGAVTIGGGLGVAGDIQSGGGFYGTLSSYSAGAVAIGSEFAVVGSGSSTKLVLFSSSATYRLFGLGAGTMTTDASGNIAITSDGDLKIDRGYFTRTIRDLMQDDADIARPRQFNWKPEAGMDDGLYTGFFANEYESGVPEAVGRDSRGYRTFSDRVAVAVLHNTAIDHERRMTALETRLAG